VYPVPDPLLPTKSDGLDTGFIDHLYTRLGTTCNYSATANLHTLQNTVANTKSSPTCSVFNSRSLATASNNGDSSASRSQILLSQRLLQSSTPNPQRTGFVFFITPLRGPHRKHRPFIVTCVFVAAGTCLSSRCSEMVVLYFPIA
jgi:hypothetical protein